MIEKSLTVFEGKQIRRHYDEETETWYFSILDVIGALTDSVNPRDYWFKMKIRVKSEDGLELSTICRQLKMHADDCFGWRKGSAQGLNGTYTGTIMIFDCSDIIKQEVRA